MKIQRFDKTENFVPPEFTPPELLVYDIRTSDGIFRVKRTMSYEASVLISSRKRRKLLPHKEQARIFLPKIPRLKFLQIVNFFREISIQHDSESMVFTYFNFEIMKYLFDPPTQTVYGVGLDWECQATPEGYCHVGDVHCHNDLPAFHSIQDDEDESDYNGIHITVGNVLEMPSISASLTVDGRRFLFNPMTLIEFSQGPKPPARWISRVTKADKSQGGA